LPRRGPRSGAGERDQLAWVTALTTNIAAPPNDGTAVGVFGCIEDKVDHPYMARTTITQITDDLDGSKDAQEVSFAFDGTEYTIDLSRKNRAAFEKALQPYIDAGAKMSKRSSTSSRRTSSSRKDYSNIRNWAKGQGIEVSDRGRIPRSIVEQYEAAH
jgi:hypothetical protein